MIRQPPDDEPEIFSGGVALVMYGQMQAERRCDGDGNEDACKHEGDDPGGAHGSRVRGTGDSHGVDKGIRDEEKELHGVVRRCPI